MFAWGFGDFKGGEIFPGRNPPPPPLYATLWAPRRGIFRWALGCAVAVLQGQDTQSLVGLFPCPLRVYSSRFMNFSEFAGNGQSSCSCRQLQHLRIVRAPCWFSRAEDEGKERGRAVGSGVDVGG